MTHSLATGRLAVAAAHTEAALAVHAPDLVDGFTAALPVAADTVGRRLRGALVREDIGDARARHAGRGRRHAFDRVEFATAAADDPVDLLGSLDAPGFAAELRNAVVNLAVALARGTGAARPPDDPDAAAVAAERLAPAGHNLHPCGRTRLGWDTVDVLAHDLEAGHTRIGLIAVRDDGHLGDDVGAALAAAWPGLPDAPPGYRLQPVHAWQRDVVLPARYGGLLRDGALRILDDEIDAAPTAALRTLLLPPGPDGRRRYLKLSLDIQVTSTRRSISVASTRNGPALSALLHRMAGADPDGHRLVLLAETAGAAVPAGSGRDMSAIVRDGLAGHLAGAERAVPGGALPAVDPATGRTVLAGLVAGYAAARGRRDDAGTARAWLDDYSRLLLPPLLRLATRGMALEAHLQNCLPTFLAGTPHRLVVRDFAGLRLHPGRLAADGHTIALWPGSVVGTGDERVLRAKIGYTALQAHLGELVIRLGESHGLDEDAAWRTVRAVVDETYAALPGPAARADHAAFTAPRVPHKALVRMRLGGAGDAYLPVRNPLHAPA
ncbi:IucA/IucC family protein [Jidongwangia harbinensis]|uniref:IucA/IucC family protein n=1 Tax=Jidongwangia harbinensis TaxID=2878561 RepID=UPI001CDA37F4|nr:IucA/IucC family protein [Jidongwangia harbinensis]MCA2214936.1 RhbF-like rhizobactin siderophore biosynthesis protein [Jidongwangia harbinensis]